MPTMDSKKRIPERMCLLCRTMKPKKSMVRVISDENGLRVDLSGKGGGRGSYVCCGEECIKKCGNRKLLSKVFRCECSEELSAELISALTERKSEL